MAHRLQQLGFTIVATEGTAEILSRNGIAVTVVEKYSETQESGAKNIVDLINEGAIDIVVNTPSGGAARADGYEIRAAAVAADKALFTTMAVLGACFAACGILLAGLPPLSGFIAKFSMLTAILNPSGLGANDSISTLSWWLVFLIVFAGFASLISMTRAGIRTFWASIEGTVPRVLVIEIAPVMLLLGLTLAMTVQAGPVMRYMQETARILDLPASYIQGVISAPRAGSNPEAEP